MCVETVQILPRSQYSIDCPCGRHVSSRHEVLDKDGGHTWNNSLSQIPTYLYLTLCGLTSLFSVEHNIAMFLFESPGKFLEIISTLTKSEVKLCKIMYQQINS
ncbi:unnamed protein product [Parnassius mnemosyne]|uniref:Uncharacterized protein n=1 Tax=Parnassius mnemosyne TaxID=213953 RepID=A0AAV1KGG0_9NEOP